MSGPVTVCADGSPAGHEALRWAAGEARRREQSLQVVVDEGRHSMAEDGAVFARAVATVRELVPGLPLLANAAGGPVPGALRELSAEASVLVVPATLPWLTSVVAETYCPVVIVPVASTEPPPAPVTGAVEPVVLGAAAWTGEEVFELAFQAAAARDAPLLAVRTWSDPRVDLGRLLPWRVLNWDATAARARRELDAALSAWTVAHPSVAVERLVVEDGAADFLLSLSHRAGLLVLGRSARGALLAGVAGSPVDALAQRARCPVMVVPAEGPPRWTWLPTRRRARASALRPPGGPAG